jgi:hypothetical protein
MHICKQPLKSDSLSEIQAKSFASVAFSSSDINIAPSGEDLLVTTNAKSGLDPDDVSDINEDIAIVFCSSTQNLAAIDATDRVITNENGDAVDVPAGQVTINDWS